MNFFVTGKTDKNSENIFSFINMKNNRENSVVFRGYIGL